MTQNYPFFGRNKNTVFSEFDNRGRKSNFKCICFWLFVGYFQIKNEKQFINLIFGLKVVLKRSCCFQTSARTGVQRLCSFGVFN